MQYTVKSQIFVRFRIVSKNEENTIKVKRERRRHAKTTWLTVRERERFRKGGKNGDV